MKVAVTCGGTGGHTYPGLATALELRRRGHRVTLWLGGRAVESTAVSGWDGPVVRIPSQGLQGGLWRSVGALVGILRAVVAARAALRRDRPDALLAMGSYASVGPVVAAWLQRVPVVLHEANAIPGRAITVLSRLARVVAISFAGTECYFPERRTLLTGLPLRAALAAATADAPFPAVFTLLVMGGSQGARVLNERVPAAAARVVAGGGRLRVLHLAGAGNGDAVAEAYRQGGVEAEVHDYAHDMVAVYRRASLAIARSGAGACAELGRFAIPTLFVPLPGAIRDHQRANARAVAVAGGAAILEQSDLTPDRLADYILGLLREPERLAAMRAAWTATSAPDGAGALAGLVEAEAGGAGARRV